MGVLAFLILLPTVAALGLLLVRSDAVRGFVVKGAALLIAILAVVLTARYLGDGHIRFDFHSEAVSYLMLGIEVVLMIVIIALGFKYRRFGVAILAAIQTPLMVWFEFTRGHHLTVANNLYVDGLSLIMVLIIGIIGSIIAVYALGYMKDFQRHHAEQADRRPWFFFLVFIFLAAMVGIVTSNNLIWMHFFWEITTLCSFFLIGYTKTEEAIRNSFRALLMNLGGGLAFTLAIVYLGIVHGTVELDVMLALGTSGTIVMIPAALLAFAGITKAAQMPFSSWLLGAMVAPTPVSALLHSSTMVKAGVFLVVKLAPVMGTYVATASGLILNWTGIMTMMVGGITFLIGSFVAISQSNAKRVLAYSTVANLGLIVACGGIGSSGAVWAAIMLIIFHAIAKSLLFLCVGTTEHRIGSRDIEDMDGLFDRLPRVAKYMMVGIYGMFLAPFGMLVSKWAAMVSFIESNNVFIVMMLVFGSAATLFFWVKWLGKLTAVVAKSENQSEGVSGEENFVLTTLAVLTVALCLFFPLLSTNAVVPYLTSLFGAMATATLSSANLLIMSILSAVIILTFAIFFGKTKSRIVPIYLAGENVGDNLRYYNSLKEPAAFSLRNWYMERYFGERRMNSIGVIATTIILTLTALVMLGGVL